MTHWTGVSPTVPVYDGRPVTNVALPGDQLPTATAWRCVCGRPLTDPTSRARGLGPVCYRRLRGTAQSRPAPAPAPASTAPVPDIEGQTELPLADHQPTLWSL